MKIFVKKQFLPIIFIACLTGCAAHPERSKDVAIGANPAQASSIPAYLASYYYSLSVHHSLNGRPNEAIGALEKALEADPRSAFLAMELAALYGESGELQKAISLCEKTLTANGRDADTHFLLARLYMNAKNYPNALREFLKVNELEPQQADALLFTGILYGEAQDYEKALLTFRKLLDFDPDHLMGNYYLAKTLKVNQQYKEAERMYKKTLAIQALFEPAVLDLGRLYEREEKKDLALEQYRAFLKINPQGINVRFRLAGLLFKMKKPVEAEKELREILDQAKGNRELAYRLSMFYLENKRYEGAAGILRELLIVYSDDQRLRFLLGSAYEGKKDYQAAIAELKKIPPESGELYPSAQMSISLMLKNLDQSEAAIANLSKALANRREVANFYILLASLYEEKKEFLKAEETLKTGLEFSPGVAMHFELGVLYDKMGRFQDSIMAMRRVLEIDGNNAEAMNFIGYTYADRGINLEEAENLIKKALTLKPGNAYMLDSLGWVYFQQNKLEEAIKYLKEAAVELPQDATIAEHLGDAYAKAGQVSAARKIYKELMRLNPENKVLSQKMQKLTGKTQD